MLKYISGLNIKEYPFSEGVWEFRHRHFVERFGWEDIRKPDGREIDDFDYDEAIHLILTDRDRIVGYSRLLPTLKPHLLSHVYPHMVDGHSYPTGRRVYEWTRCVAEPGAFLDGLPASNILMTGVMEFCLSCGIATLIVETHPKLVNWLTTAGWETTPIAPPVLLAGGPVLPIEAKPSLQGLTQHHQHYGVNGSVLDFELDPVNPINGRAFEQIVENKHGEVVSSRGARYANR